MQRVLKWNLIAEIFTRMKHRVTKWFFAAHYRVQWDQFKRNNSQEWKKHIVVGLNSLLLYSTDWVFSDFLTKESANLALLYTEFFLFFNENYTF